MACGGEFGNYTDQETHLLCLGHRYYDPGTGRFLNRDPIGYAGGENLYAYCDGNPINAIDPDGEDLLDDASNFSAGMGDFLSGGATGWVRQRLGVDGIVDRSSGAYVGAEVAGVAVGVVDAGASAVGAVRMIRAAGGVRAAVGLARSAAAARVGYLTQSYLKATYRFSGSGAQLKDVQAFIAATYKAFRAEGGTVQYLDIKDAPARLFNSNGGNLNASKPLIVLIKGRTSLATFVEELIHYDQAAKAGLRGRDLTAVDGEFEADAEKRLLAWGFQYLK